MKDKLADNKYIQEYDKAIKYIYDMMAQGKVGIGDKLPAERVIAEELGIGRNSIREALSILGGMGIIERRQGSGNYISPNIGKSISQTIKMMIALKGVSVKEVCTFRRLMEKSVCNILCEQGISDAQIKELRDLLKKMQNSGNDKNAKADKRFHDLLILDTQNKLLIIIMEAVTDVYREWIGYVLEHIDDEGYKKLLKCHIDILNSIEHRNSTAVNEAVDCHYDIIDELFENAEEGIV